MEKTSYYYDLKANEGDFQRLYVKMANFLNFATHMISSSYKILF